MKLFVTGASGYIGGSVAALLVARGHNVRGLVRDRAKAELLLAHGIQPVHGSLEDEELIAREANAADAVVNTADADHLPSLRAMLGAMQGTGKTLIHTSGSSLVGDDARGNRTAEAIFDEDTPLVVAEGKQARHALNATVQAAAARGVRTVIICPALIYGEGRGLHRESIQIPFLVQEARRQGVVRVIGQGLNRWSTVHIDDLVDLYVLALEKAPPGAFYFAENGEASFAGIGEAIAARLGLGNIASIDADEAARMWGPARAYFTYGSNSRVRAARARRELGWTPRHESALTWIRNEMDL